MKNRNAELLEALPRVRRFAYSLTGNMADADDLLQSTVERLLQKGIPDDASLVRWSLRVCRNLWIDEIRSRKVRQAVADDPDSIAPEDSAGEDGDVVALSLDEALAVVSSLPEEQRAVLQLVAVEGYSYREAADLLSAPIGTVMSRLARARARLVEACGLERDVQDE